MLPEYRTSPPYVCPNPTLRVGWRVDNNTSGRGGIGPFLANDPSDSKHTARPFRNAPTRSRVVSDTTKGRVYFNDLGVGADPSNV